MRSSRRTFGFVAIVLIACTVLASCSTPTSPTPKGLSLEGLWRVTPGTGTAYGSGGTTTLEFGAGSGGMATFLSLKDSSGVTVCDQDVYSILPGNVVLLDGTYYSAVARTDQVVLKTATDTITLDRVTDGSPVTPCREAHATATFSSDAGLGGTSTLSGVGTVLYFNQGDEAIVGYDTATDILGAPRSYTDYVSGGYHFWVVAARSDDLFYGQCYCGGSNTLDYFDLSTDTSLAWTDFYPLHNSFGVRFGYFDGTNAVIGGREWVGDEQMPRLITVNAGTLAVVEDRQVLWGASVIAVTLHAGTVYALVDNSIVTIGDDGKAEQTYKLDGLGALMARGIASAGGKLYAVAGNESAVTIYEVELD